MELMQRKIRYNADKSFSLYHLCYYFSKTGFRNNDTKLVLNFKNQNEEAIRHFIIQALENLQFRQIDDDFVIIRALHSFETIADSASSNPLNRLGESMAAVFDCTYFPKIIYKTRATQAVKTLNMIQRKAELDGVYQVDQSIFNFNYRKVLILDDVVTTGATVCSIIKAILDAYPHAKIDAFALAWTPTENQQAYLQQQERQAMLLKEPEFEYGTRKSNEWVDEDIENGETNISVYV